MDAQRVQEAPSGSEDLEIPQQVAVPDVWDRLPILAWALFLVILPFFPSQDGPFHLHQGSALLAWILGDPSARALFELQEGLFTNWTSAVVLGDLQVLLGLTPAWAERVWLVLLVAVWVDAFAHLRAKLGTSRLLPWLVLLLFQGRVAHMGFWNFLFSVGLALWAWARDGHDGAWRLSPLGFVAFLLALASHPFGAMLYLALVVTEVVLGGWRQGVRRLLWLSPLALLSVFTLPRGDGWFMEFLPPAWPDVLGRDLGPWLETWRLEAVPRLVLLVLLGLWAWVQWRANGFRPGLREWLFRSPRRTTLLLAALGALALASIGPESLGSGSQVRARFTLLAWACGLLALPLTAPAHGAGWARRLPSLSGFFLALALLPAGAHSFAVAQGQAKLLDRLPPLERGQWVAIARDVEGMGAILWQYQPEVHLPERWLATHRAFNPFSYPMQTDHFPLVSRRPAPSAWSDTLKWRPFRAPWEMLAADLDAFVVLGPPPDIDRGLIPRLAPAWEPTVMAFEEFPGMVLFTSSQVRPLVERTPESWPMVPLLQPKAIPLDPRLPRERLVLPVGPSHAHWRWRAFLWQEGGAPIPASEEWIRPISGRFDHRGVLEIESWTPPDSPRVLVLMPG